MAEGIPGQAGHAFHTCRPSSHQGIKALKDLMASFGFEGPLGQVVEGNVLLLPDIEVGTFDEAQLERLLADLRD